MADSADEPSREFGTGAGSARRTSARPNAVWDGERLAGAIRSAGPPLLFGLRLWASVCLALYVAFWLQLDDAYWAGGTAAIVCQPSLGASLRKGAFRMVGTVIGAVAIVILTAFFPQDRTGFLVGLALWGAVCGFMATVLPPTERRWPATRPRSSRAPSSARPGVRTERPSPSR